MTEDTIQERIDKLEAEMATLQTNHDNTVKQFNQIVTQNQTRYAALKGGVSELTALKEQIQLNGNVDSTVPATSRRKGTRDAVSLPSR